MASICNDERGVTGVEGHLPGYLNYPDGFDIDVFRDWKRAPKTP